MKSWLCDEWAKSGAGYAPNPTGWPASVTMPALTDAGQIKRQPALTQRAMVSHAAPALLTIPVEGKSGHITASER